MPESATYWSEFMVGPLPIRVPSSNDLYEHFLAQIVAATRVPRDVFTGEADVRPDFVVVGGEG